VVKEVSTGDLLITEEDKSPPMCVLTSGVCQIVYAGSTTKLDTKVTSLSKSFVLEINIRLGKNQERSKKEKR
jgi:hypothetical protein